MKKRGSIAHEPTSRTRSRTDAEQELAHIIAAGAELPRSSAEGGGSSPPISPVDEQDEIDQRLQAISRFEVPRADDTPLCAFRPMPVRSAELREEIVHITGKQARERAHTAHIDDYLSEVQQGRLQEMHRRKVFEWNIAVRELP